MLKIFSIVVMLLVASCSNNVPEHVNPSAIQQFKTIAIGEVRFASSIKGSNELKVAFAEKIKTKLYQEGLGAAYVRYAQKDTLVITANFDEYENGNASSRILFGGGAGQTKITGVVRLVDNKNKLIESLDGRRESLSMGGMFAGQQTADSLLDDVARYAVNEVKRIIEGV